MEHRWGERVKVSIPIRLTTSHPPWVRTGELSNLSVSGALITTDCSVRLLSRIEIVLDSPLRPKHDAPVVAGYVARQYKGAIGIEWCEFAPPDVTKLLQVLGARPHARLGRVPRETNQIRARLSQPLLKHKLGV
jgi:hypothetical protein